ncbi:MAG TPA: HAMP domain-containing protein, partial [Devosiaceae bacterium]
MRLSRFSLIGGLLAAVIAVIGTVVTIYFGMAAQGQLAEAVSISNQKSQQLLALSEALRDSHLDVVQVQQYFTDVSATRGYNGLDDGPAKAAESAKSFEADSGKARELAVAMGLDGVVQALDQMTKDFPDYFATGKKMAEAYMAGGALVGNKIMPEFDAAAEKLGAAITQMREQNAVAQQAMIADTENRQAAALAFSQQGRLIGVALNIVVVIAVVGSTIFVAGYVLPSFDRMTGGLDALAAGEEEVDVPNVTFWAELSRMSNAITVFSDNNAKVREMQRDERAHSEQTQERARAMSALLHEVGEVVDAAASGDFTRRVSAEFSDAELNRLAEGVNTLVETVERGLSETG